MVRVGAVVDGRVVQPRYGRARRAARGGAQLARRHGRGARRAHAQRTQRHATARLRPPLLTKLYFMNR